MSHLSGGLFGKKRSVGEQDHSGGTGKEKRDWKRTCRYILQRVDRYGCYVGTVAIHRWARFTKVMKKFFTSLGIALRRLPHNIRKSFALFLVWAKKHIAYPLERAFHHVVQGAKEVHRAHKDPNRSGREQLGHWYGRTKPTLFKVLNYLMPVAALGVSAAVIALILNFNFVLKVEYNDQVVGYVDSETTFNEAKKVVNDRIAIKDEEGSEFIKSPTYSIAVVPKAEVVTTEALADTLIASSGEEITEAAGLYVDGVLQGAVVDATALQAELAAIKAPYVEEYPEGTVDFSKSVEIKPGLYPNETVKSDEEIIALLHSEEQAEKTYTAESGDTPIGIAAKNNVTLSELVALNPTIEDSLYAGTPVRVQRSVPYLQVKVVREITYEESIPYETETSETNSYNKGYEKVVVQGQEGVKEITAKQTLIGGEETDKEILAAKVISEPVTEKKVVGTNVPAPSYSGSTQTYNGSGPTGSGSLRWPVAGGYVSCGYWGYYGHTGMDIAAPSGTAIYAADDGVVSKVSTSGPYGYHIIINHGNGMQTLYAHCSALYVSAGQSVSRGQKIAAVGRTGNATGNHCHFEVRVGGSARNPASYV